MISDIWDILVYRLLKSAQILAAFKPELGDIWNEINQNDPLFTIIILNKKKKVEEQIKLKFCIILLYFIFQF